MGGSWFCFVSFELAFHLPESPTLIFESSLPARVSMWSRSCVRFASAACSFGAFVLPGTRLALEDALPSGRRVCWIPQWQGLALAGLQQVRRVWTCCNGCSRHSCRLSFRCTGGPHAFRLAGHDQGGGIEDKSALASAGARVGSPMGRGPGRSHELSGRHVRSVHGGYQAIKRPSPVT